MGHVFAFLAKFTVPDPGRQPNMQSYLLKFFVETRLRSESSELGFLAYVELKLWLKKNIFDKDTKVPWKVCYGQP